MKINKITSYKYNLLTLKLIKTKIYKKNQNHFIKIENISTKLKKALHIIYKYHTNNKRILFVGVPLSVTIHFNNFLKNTKHTLIPKSMRANGIITNQESYFKHRSKNQKIRNDKISKFLFQIKKKSDLIVIFDSKSNISVLNESYTTKIPIVSINCDSNILDIKSNYKVPGNFKFVGKKIRNTLLYSILILTLKKANKTLKKT